MHRNKSVSAHQFSMVPRADIPRSAIRMQKSLKTTFDATYLIPVFCEEVLPGDKVKVDMTAFARLATPLFPFMDNLHLESFWFFCPNRLVWDNWVKFMGEQVDPDDSTDYLIPQIETPDQGYTIGTLGDYFGLPTVGQVPAANSVLHSALPLRMYNLIWNEWFRDENLQDSVLVHRDDGPDAFTDYDLLARGKRHDYFTSCLPFLQKGDAVDIPLYGSVGGTGVGGPAPIPNVQGGVPVRTLDSGLVAGVQQPMFLKDIAGLSQNNKTLGTSAGSGLAASATAFTAVAGMYPTNLYADFTDTTAGTINALRTAFQVQKLLERDARGGTRYTEIVRSHFGVISPDARLQRPEYLGGGSIAIAVNPVAQTSATSAEGTDTPQGTLSAIGTGLMRSSFTQAFTEHGYIIALVNVRADISYQQGLRRHWSRRTRYDFYFPVFANLGEQAVLSKEIFCQGENPPTVGGLDETVFGYQERWAEYRYNPSEITGLFRSTAAQTIDPWHLAEHFTTRPELNANFIRDTAQTNLERVIAVGAAAGGQQLIMDCFYDMVWVRPMPLYSVPGMVDHF